MVFKKNSDLDIEKQIIKELQEVRETFSVLARADIIAVTRKKPRRGFPIEEPLRKFLERNFDSNPLMKKMTEVLWFTDIEYYPIYSRTWVGRRITGATWSKRLKCWQYDRGYVDKVFDNLVSWYPPMVSWLMINWMKMSDWTDALEFYIKKWWDDYTKKWLFERWRYR